MSIFSSRRRHRAQPGHRPALHKALFVGVLGLTVAASASLPPTASLPSATADPPQPAAVTSPAAAVQLAAPAAQAPALAQPGQAPASPLDEPLKLIAQARQAYQGVRTYTCTLVSQERVRGVLGPQRVMAFTFKAPFSIYMRWLGPKDEVGREVAYVHGKNKNMMRVHDNKGLGKMIGFVALAPNDPRVLEQTRHTILEAGIGNMIERFAQAWLRERGVGKARVQMAEYDYNQKRCLRVEVVQTVKNPQLYCYRSVVYFDKQSRLPIRVECYDWPRPGGPAGGDLLESFSYANLQLNVQVNDSIFNR